MGDIDDDDAPLNPWAVWNWPRPILMALIVGAFPFLAVFALVFLPLFIHGAGGVALIPPTPVPVPPTGPHIIIVANVSFVSRDDFIADLTDARGGPASEESDDIQFAAFLDDVEDIQREQVTILRDLIAEHDIQAVYLEGVTDENVEVFRARVKELVCPRDRTANGGH